MPHPYSHPHSHATPIYSHYVEVSVIENLLCDSFHDGFRLYWQDQNIVDSEGCTYVLQAAIAPSNDYSLIYRG